MEMKYSIKLYTESIWTVVSGETIEISFKYELFHAL